MIRAWRVCRTKWAAAAFTGDGAKAYAGRWNSAGIPVVYAADSPASAVLEIVVHVDDAIAKLDYVLIPVDFDDALVDPLDLSHLPPRWTDFKHRDAVRALGDAWIHSGRSVILRVPSALVPHTSNYLINPAHPQFVELKIGRPEPCPIDRRIKK